jgi:pimeloyl-ACP methyl ester carboxylesterase
MAVLICAALIPPQVAGSGELVKTIGSFGSINIPTLHVIGKKDPCYSQSLELVKSCQKGSSQVILTNGGHHVPRDSVSARSIATAIESTLQVALLG